MRLKFEKLRQFASSVDFKLYTTLAVLLINAVIAVSIAANLYTEKVQSKANGNYKNAMLVTNFGDIEFSFNKKAPQAVTNFAKLTNSGFYSETKFHRVVPSLLIEGGDPLSKRDDLKYKWGNGGPGYVFEDEINSGDKMLRGTVAMVNNGPNTNGSQFFILVKDSEWLDGQHTILGFVTKGMDVVDKIANIKVGVTGIPTEDVVVHQIILK